jgi:opacity protein-like surface antigen
METFMKSMLVLAGALVVVSSAAFAPVALAEGCPQSRTSNDNVAGMGGSSHGRVLSANEAAQAASPNCSMPASETSNGNGAGLGGSTHGRRWQ